VPFLDHDCCLRIFDGVISGSSFLSFSLYYIFPFSPPFVVDFFFLSPFYYLSLFLADSHVSSVKISPFWIYTCTPSATWSLSSGHRSPTFLELSSSQPRFPFFWVCWSFLNLHRLPAPPSKNLTQVFQAVPFLFSNFYHFGGLAPPEFYFTHTSPFPLICILPWKKEYLSPLSGSRGCFFSLFEWQ